MDLNTNKFNDQLYRAFNVILIIISSYAAAILLMKFVDREIRWAIGFLIVVIFVAIVAVIRNKKHFLFATLIISFSIQTAFFLWQPSITSYPHGKGPLTAPEVYAFDLPLILLFLLVVTSKMKTKCAEFIKSDIAALLLILIAILSFVKSGYIAYSFTGLLVMLRMPIIYYCFSRGITCNNDLKCVMWAFIFCVFIQSFLGIAQAFFGSFTFLQRLVESAEQVRMTQVGSFTFARPYGTIGYTTVFSQYLGMLSPLALAFFLYGDRWRQKLSGFTYFLALIVLILSLSRAEWLNIILVFFLILFMGIRKGRVKKSFFRIIAILLIFVITGAMFYERIIVRATMPDYGSAFERIPMTKIAINMILNNPILGVGINNYTEVMYKFGMGKLLPGQVYGVHNSFLFLAAEMGIAALLLLLYLWFVTYKRLIFCFGSENKMIWILSAGLICGLTALFIHSNVEQGFHVHQQLNAVLWSLFGMAAAMRAIVIKNNNEALVANGT